MWHDTATAAAAAANATACGSLRRRGCGCLSGQQLRQRRPFEIDDFRLQVTAPSPLALSPPLGTLECGGGVLALARAGLQRAVVVVTVARMAVAVFAVVAVIRITAAVALLPFAVRVAIRVVVHFAPQSDDHGRVVVADNGSECAAVAAAA